MPLTIDDSRPNNIISYLEAGATSSMATFTMRGSRNRLAIGQTRFGGQQFQVSPSGLAATSRSAENCHLGSLFIYARERCPSFDWKATRPSMDGPGCYCTKKGKITIGGWMSFSRRRSTLPLGYCILLSDAQSRKRLNPGPRRDDRDSVWVGQRAIILKGSHIEAVRLSEQLPWCGTPPGIHWQLVTAKVTPVRVTWGHKLSSTITTAVKTKRRSRQFGQAPCQTSRGLPDNREFNCRTAQR